MAKVPSIKIKVVKLDALKNYEFNPRDNAAAIDAVASSISEFGFLVPIVADKDGVIVAGHTRHAAATRLGLTEVPVIYAEHLSPAQADAFRLVDNKVSELATWDMDLLAKEIAGLAEAGLDFTSFGWSQEEIDCLSTMVDSDCLSEVASQVEVVATPSNDASASLALAPNAASAAAAAQMQRERVVLSNPQSVGIRIGEINFFVTVPVYEHWLAETRKAVDFDQARLAGLIAERLGIADVADTLRAEGKIGASPVIGTSPQALNPPVVRERTRPTPAA